MDPPPPDEPGVDQLGHVVPVQVDRRGVHGDQGRDVLVPAVGTLDDIVGPVVIVVTGATLVNIFIIRLSLNIFLLIFAPKNVIITTVKQFVKFFSVAKATLHSQMSVRSSVRSSVCHKPKPKINHSALIPS